MVIGAVGRSLYDRSEERWRIKGAVTDAVEIGREGESEQEERR